MTSTRGWSCCAAPSRAEGGSLEQTCDAVLSELTGRSSEDDIAIIMAQARPAGSDRIATLPLDDDHAMVAHSRRFTRETLTGWGLAPLADWAELLTSELITNALVHAGSPTQLRLLCNRTLTVEVADRDSRHAPDAARRRGGRGRARHPPRQRARPPVGHPADAGREGRVVRTGAAAGAVGTVSPRPDGSGPGPVPPRPVPARPAPPRGGRSRTTVYEGT